MIYHTTVYNDTSHQTTAWYITYHTALSTTQWYIIPHYRRQHQNKDYLNIERRPQSWRWTQTEDNLKTEDDLKNEEDLKNEDNLKNEEDLKNWPSPPFFFGSPPPLPLKNLPEVFCWWLLTLTARPQLMLNRKWYQVSKPEMEFHIINIMYAALPMRAHTNRKDNIFMQRRLYIDEAHMALDIFPLRLQYDLCHTTRSQYYPYIRGQKWWFWNQLKNEK